jgi:hypothetical protein
MQNSLDWVLKLFIQRIFLFVNCFNLFSVYSYHLFIGTFASIIDLYYFSKSKKKLITSLKFLEFNFAHCTVKVKNT